MQTKSIYEDLEHCLPENNGNKNIGSTFLAVAVLSALGFVGNWLSTPAAYGVSFIFGSIFTVVAVGLFGVWWGTAAALIASSYTQLLWGHPYAIVIFTAEALWIGLALKRGNSSVLLIDVLYWCTLGPLLVFLFYGGAMKLGTQSVMIIMLKQAINGTLNALIAGAILLYAPLRRWIKPDQADTKVPYAIILLHVTTAFLMIPTLILLILLNYLEIKSSHATIAQYVKTEADQTERVICHWLSGNMEAVKAVTNLGYIYPLEPSARLQEALETIKGPFPDFHNFFIADKTGTTIAFYPARNERGESTIGINFSDRSYYSQLKETMRPVVSDVFHGRGGIFTEIFSISIPIIKDGEFAGFGLGAINLDRLRKFLIEVSGQTNTTYTILDHNNACLVSTNSNRKPLDRLPETEASIEESDTPGVFLIIPGSNKNISVMEAWKDAAYVTKVPIPDSGWVLLVEYSLAPLQKHFYNTTIQGLMIVSALFILSILVAPWLTRKITRPLARLTVLSRDIPDRIEKQELLDWPTTSIAEMWELIANFMQTSEALRLKIEDIVATNILLQDEQAMLLTRIKEQHCLYKIFAVTEDMESPLGAQLLEVVDVVASGWQYPEIAAIRIEYGGVTYNTPNFNESPWMQIAEATTAQGNVARITVSYLEERPQEDEGAFLKEERKLLDAILYRIVDSIDRRLTAEKLLESQERFKALHNASFGGIAIHDKGIILECNQGLSEMTGYSEAELVGMDGLLLLAEQSRNTVWQNILNGYEKPYEVIGLRKDGTEYPVCLEARNIPYRGKSVRTVEFRDISESKRSEEARKVLQEQLTQAQKMESVGRLAGGVAHDFNNMLAIILGYTEMALDNPELSEPIRTDLDEIRKAANRSGDLVRQLLAFARKQTISLKVLDLNETVEGILKMLRRLIGENIDVTWLPGSNVGPVRMDPSQIDQILANLFVNARDAIEDVGKITIETGNVTFDEAYCKDHAGFIPGGYDLLAVSDNGNGMSQETLKNIFEPFFTTKELGKGTGLGLATVYGIVKQNNGFINAYSEPGKGTVFKIYLPRYEVKSTQIPLKDQIVKNTRGNETILLVEDEPVILKMATSMLERIGYHVIGAQTPEESIRMAHEHSGEIHLLMTDVVMPKMNGRDLARYLLSLYPDMKCLFMSGYTANVIAHHGVLDEGVNFIEKPFSKQHLADMVRKSLTETN